MSDPKNGTSRPKGAFGSTRDLSKPVVVIAPKTGAPAKPAAGAPRPASVARAESAAKISPARAAAFHILSRVAASASHSDDLLHSVTVNELSAEDRNLTTALVLGVLRWQLHLDALLRPMMQRPDAEIHPAALLALRLGLFQLLYLDRVPAHAALNESVELARANGAAHAAGMVNALLRRVLRERSAAQRNTLAVATTPAEQAHPEWLVKRWRESFGLKTTRTIAEYDQQEPPSHALFEAEDGLPDIDDGSRLVAEIASAAAPAAKRILDCCAAPGGKTAVLAVRHPDAEIVASDVSEKRLEAMRKRLGTSRVKTVLNDMTQPTLQGTFDLILCDAPCSGTGTLARNPEIRHRLRPSDLPRQSQRQQAILTNALTLLAPGGRVVYSTCSLEPEENEAVVKAVLDASPNARQLSTAALLDAIESMTPTMREALQLNATTGDALRTLPGVTECDGFFVAVLERTN